MAAWLTNSFAFLQTTAWNLQESTTHISEWKEVKIIFIVSQSNQFDILFEFLINSKVKWKWKIEFWRQSVIKTLSCFDCCYFCYFLCRFEPFARFNFVLFNDFSHFTCYLFDTSLLSLVCWNMIRVKLSDMITERYSFNLQIIKWI